MQTPSAPASAGGSEALKAESQVQMPATPSFHASSPTAPRRGRPRGRELTVPFSTRISQDVSELIDAISDEQGLTQRSIIEVAVREYWGARAEGTTR